jgi:hypothetical protein
MSSRPRRAAAAAFVSDADAKDGRRADAPRRNRIGRRDSIVGMLSADCCLDHLSIELIIDEYEYHPTSLLKYGPARRHCYRRVCCCEPIPRRFTQRADDGRDHRDRGARGLTDRSLLFQLN